MSVQSLLFSVTRVFHSAQNTKPDLLACVTPPCPFNHYSSKSPGYLPLNSKYTQTHLFPNSDAHTFGRSKQVQRGTDSDRAPRMFWFCYFAIHRHTHPPTETEPFRWGVWGLGRSLRDREGSGGVGTQARPSTRWRSRALHTQRDRKSSERKLCQFEKQF